MLLWLAALPCARFEARGDSGAEHLHLGEAQIVGAAELHAHIAALRARPVMSADGLGAVV